MFSSSCASCAHRHTCGRRHRHAPTLYASGSSSSAAKERTSSVRRGECTSREKALPAVRPLDRAASGFFGVELRRAGVVSPPRLRSGVGAHEAEAQPLHAWPQRQQLCNHHLRAVCLVLGPQNGDVQVRGEAQLRADGAAAPKLVHAGEQREGWRQDERQRCVRGVTTQRTPRRPRLGVPVAAVDGGRPRLLRLHCCGRQLDGAGRGEVWCCSVGICVQFTVMAGTLVEMQRSFGAQVKVRCCAQALACHHRGAAGVHSTSSSEFQSSHAHK